MDITYAVTTQRFMKNMKPGETWTEPDFTTTRETIDRARNDHHIRIESESPDGLPDVFHYVDSINAWTKTYRRQEVTA